MSELNLVKTETTTSDGTLVHLVYDQEADHLEIFFGENESATGVEITDHIVLRFNRRSKRAISLLLLDFSILTERTEYGPRSFPLNKLDNLPEDLQDMVFQIIMSMPVSQFLKVSHFQVSPTEQIPLTFVDIKPTMAAI
ncbi:MAG: hypothetical protein ACI8V2_000127 [Candidatus Latescibacterota bacterium]|jgi:hypothetical protein